MTLLFAFIGEINTIATIDVDGDGSYEAFVGTSEGLYFYGEGPESPPKKVEGINSPVLHISYYDDRHLLVTMDDIFTPVVVVSYDGSEFKTLKVTGRYSKAYALNGAVFLLSESGLFLLRDDTLSLLLEGARDVTVCGVGGERRIYASSDNRTVIVSVDRMDTLNFGSSFVMCGDTAVYTEYGAVTVRNGSPVPEFKDFAYEPHTSVDGLVLKLRGGMLSINGSIKGESNAAAFYPRNGRLYLLYGRYSLRAQPLYRPFVWADFPFIIRIGRVPVKVLDLNLMNSTSVGVLPLSPGEYNVKAEGREMRLQILHPEGYDLSSHLSEASPVSISYVPGGVEIYVSLDRPSFVEVVILGFTGKVVKHLFSGYRRGAFKLVWDGELDGGRIARRGVYFVRVKVEGRTYNKRFVWLK